MLIVNGAINSEFNIGSSNVHIRNAVGITAQGEILFVLSEDPVNFYLLSEFMKTELLCSDALYLDGAVSQAWITSNSGHKVRKAIRGNNAVGPIILVSAK